MPRYHHGSCCRWDKYITNNRCVYVDDANNYAEHEGEEVIPEVDDDGEIPEDDYITEVIGILQQSAQFWSDLVALTGGLMAFHKCTWQILTWMIKNGEVIMRHRDHI